MTTKPQSDHVIVHVPNSLKNKVAVTGGGGGLDMAAIQRAEKALEQMSGKFEEWLVDELGKLKEARALVTENGLNKETVKKLFRASHDIKGQAATLGYPLVGNFCSSLCNLLEHIEHVERIPLALIDQHVDAAIAVHRDQVKTPEHPVASVVAERLHEVVVDFIDQETKPNAPAPRAAGSSA